jgi:TonB family protein
MSHGSQQYFLERARFSRRVSLLSAGVSLALLAGEALLLVPAVRQSVVEQAIRHGLDARHFGFEGPEQYVRRIVLDASGPPGAHPGRTIILSRSVQTVKGGRSQAASSPDPHARPDTRHRGTGPGESTADLVALARIQYGGTGPVMRSEDFVVEKMVKPDYPEGPLERNSEGLVALGALVDTTGAVTRVDLVSSPGDRELEAVAIAAARQYHFRPCRIGGRVTEAYAIIRFEFKIYD